MKESAETGWWPLIQDPQARQSLHEQRERLKPRLMEARWKEERGVISRDFDALSLVEDELILSLPLVPRHEVCPEHLPSQVEDEAFEAASERPNPFAALAALKKGN